jgi:hypothetical protein
MRWLKHLFGRTDAQELQAPPHLQFLCEQDGDVEQTLKTNWIPVLRNTPAVERAYLVCVKSYDGNPANVALCLRHAGGGDPALVDELGDCFRSMFAGSESLDIMFVPEDREDELRAVCRPFYQRV